MWLTTQKGKRVTTPRILIVEDDVVSCLGMANMLMEHGFEVGVADTETRALSMLQEFGSVNVILLDIDLPNLSGWGLKERLKLHPVFSKIPVIIMADNKASILDELIRALAG